MLPLELRHLPLRSASGECRLDSGIRRLACDAADSANRPRHPAEPAARRPSRPQAYLPSLGPPPSNGDERLQSQDHSPEGTGAGIFDAVASAVSSEQSPRSVAASTRKSTPTRAIAASNVPGRSSERQRRTSGRLLRSAGLRGYLRRRFIECLAMSLRRRRAKTQSEPHSAEGSLSNRAQTAACGRRQSTEPIVGASEDSSPALSKDGLSLYFTSDRPDGGYG